MIVTGLSAWTARSVANLARTSQGSIRRAVFSAASKWSGGWCRRATISPTCGPDRFQQNVTVPFGKDRGYADAAVFPFARREIIP